MVALFSSAKFDFGQAWTGAYGRAAHFLDRSIALFAPGYAKQRALSRLQFEALSHGYGYAGARAGALSRWRPFGGSANTDTIWDLPELRARSRDLNRNNPAACAATNVTVTRSIGTGLTMQPRIDREFLGLDDDQADAWQADTRRRFELWAESVFCDAERKLNFYGLQAVQQRAALESGDVFVLLPSIPRPAADSTLAIQLIEADRVSIPVGKTNSDTHCEGIDFDAYGAPVTVYVSNRHPGDLLSGKVQQWTAVQVFGQSGRRNVLQIFGTPETLRPQQARGVPLLAPVIEPLKQLSRYTEAELQAAINNAIFGLFVEMETDAFNDLFGGGNDVFSEADKKVFIDSRLAWEGEMTGGKAVNLLPGEKVHDVKPSHPNAGLDPFMAAVLKQVGAALGLPFEVLILSFNSSYSAARAALLAAWQMFKLRREHSATYFCQPIYELWLEEQVLLGNLRAPGFRVSEAYRKAWAGAHWIGDGPGSIDPAREADGIEKRINIGVSTLDAESIAYDGLPFDEKHRQRVKEKQMRVNGGLEASIGAPAGAQQPAVEPFNPGGKP